MTRRPPVDAGGRHETRTASTSALARTPLGALGALGALDDERRLTLLGRELARLPLDPRAARRRLRDAAPPCLAG